MKHISTHYECDDLRHYQFARTCPGFYVDRRTLSQRIAWPAVAALAADVANMFAIS